LAARIFAVSFSLPCCLQRSPHCPRRSSSSVRRATMPIRAPLRAQHHQLRRRRGEPLHRPPDHHRHVPLLQQPHALRRRPAAPRGYPARCDAGELGGMARDGSGPRFAAWGPEVRQRRRARLPAATRFARAARRNSRCSTASSSWLRRMGHRSFIWTTSSSNRRMPLDSVSRYRAAPSAGGREGTGDGTSDGFHTAPTGLRRRLASGLCTAARPAVGSCPPGKASPANRSTRPCRWPG